MPELRVAKIALHLHGAFGRIADGGHVAVLPLRTETAGSATVAGSAHLWQLVVDRNRWGSGLASALLSAALADARARGLHRVVLWTPRDHARARRFYEREGFAATGVGRFDPELGLGLVEYARGLVEPGARG